MTVIKKYTAIMVLEELHDSSLIGDYDKPMFAFGTINGLIHGDFYGRQYPEKEFDTEQQAIEFAYKENKYANWMIVPIIQFKE